MLVPVQLPEVEGVLMVVVAALKKMASVEVPVEALLEESLVEVLVFLLAAVAVFLLSSSDLVR